MEMAQEQMPECYGRPDGDDAASVRAHSSQSVRSEINSVRSEVNSVLESESNGRISETAINNNNIEQYRFTPQPRDPPSQVIPATPPPSLSDFADYPLPDNMPEKKAAKLAYPQPATGVQDCFRWVDVEPSPAGRQDLNSAESGRPYQHKFILRKSDIGKARDCGYEIPTPPPPKPKDDETAGEALRGWPGLKPQREEGPAVVCSREEKDKNLSDILAHKYIEGDPDQEKKGKKVRVSSAEQKIIDEMAKRPMKVSTTMKVPKSYDGTITGRRPWRS